MCQGRNETGPFSGQENAFPRGWVRLGIWGR